MSTQTPTRSPDAEPSLLRRYRVPLALAVVVVVGVGLWLTQPWLLFVDEEVDTAFDVSISDAGGDDTDGSAAVEDDDAATDDGASDASDEQDAATDAAAEEEDGAADEPAADEREDDATADQAEPAEEEDAAPAEPSGPVLLASGQWQDRDHPASGQVAFFELEDGSRVLRLEDLQTDNGPDLFVYLDTDGPDAEAGAYDDGINLGRLQGNVGNQTYEIPDDVDLTANTTVIIWCDRFSVPFGTAQLATA